MMRKLVATIFALSFAAIGCGSDNGTTNTPDAAKPDGAKLDVVSQSGPETQADVAIPDVAQPDTAKLDVVVVDQAQPPVDQGTQVDQVVVPVDGPTDTYIPPVDGPKPDGPKPTVDGGVDGGSVDGHNQVDSSPTVDGGVDGGSVG